MKKLLSLLLSLALIAGIAVPFAPIAAANTSESFLSVVRGYWEGVNSSELRIEPLSVDADDVAPESGDNINKGRNCYIDLGEETFVNLSEFPIEAFSIDGGVKWRKGVPPQKLDKFFSKDLTLWLASNFDSKTKKPAKGKAASADGEIAAEPGATIVKFPKIDKRDKVVKPVINYSIGSENEGGRINANGSGSAGYWVPMKEKGVLFGQMTEKKWEDLEAYIDTLQIATAFDNKKTPDVPAVEGASSWYYFDKTPVSPTAAGGRPSRDVYLVRSAPVAGETVGSRQVYRPASRPVRLTVSGAIAAPKVRLNYNTETIKPRAGMCLDVGQTNVQAYKKGDDALKAGVSFSGMLRTGESDVGEAWTVATDRRPASMVREIKFAPRANVSDIVIEVTNGRIMLDRKYEVWDSAKKKYGGLPRITESITIGSANTPGIRIKNTVRVDKDGNFEAGTFAASNDAVLTIVWGAIDERRSGITSATLVPLTPPTPFSEEPNAPETP